MTSRRSTRAGILLSKIKRRSLKGGSNIMSIVGKVNFKNPMEDVKVQIRNPAHGAKDHFRKVGKSHLKAHDLMGKRNLENPCK